VSSELQAVKEGSSLWAVNSFRSEKEEGKMGIDLRAGGRRVGHNVRKAPVSKNVYIKLLEKLYR
jgi:hypothetical protein